eukprot:522020-Amphidinium_carterae.1
MVCLERGGAGPLQFGGTGAHRLRANRQQLQLVQPINAGSALVLGPAAERNILFMLGGRHPAEESRADGAPWLQQEVGHSAKLWVSSHLMHPPTEPNFRQSTT